MQSVSDWWAQRHDQQRPWLILGKGPSLDAQSLPPAAHYHRLSLNHAVTRQPVLVASAVDLEIIQDCAEAIHGNAEYLLMPRHPHRGFKPTSEPLEHWFSEYPLLAMLSRQGRLLWYNFFNALPHSGAPVVPRGRFSAQVMVNLLALLGVQQIRTLGVDGGVAYASGFNHRDRLANRHPHFDVQWQGIAHTVRRYRIDYAPLGVEVPLEVAISIDEATHLAAQVLAYSLQRHNPLGMTFSLMDTPPATGVCLDATALAVGYWLPPASPPLLHFSDSIIWPWKNRRHPQSDLWLNYLADAVHEGFISGQMLERAIHGGWVRRSLRLELRLPRHYRNALYRYGRHLHGMGGG